MTELGFRPPRNIAESFSSGQQQQAEARNGRSKITAEIPTTAPAYPEKLDVARIQRAAAARDALRKLGGV